MPFVNAIQQKIASLPVGSARRAILEFLAVNARGRANVQSWDVIADHLRELELSMDKVSFQTGLLASTRDGEVFIGSSRLGFYVIEDRDDAVATMKFIQRRVTSHLDRLKHLNELAVKEGWAKLPIKVSQ